MSNPFMHDFNLSRWSLDHRQFIGFLVAVAAVAGLLSYFSLGRKEDPEFTVKTMMITVGWPGASAGQMAQQVIKPIETMLAENIPEIDYVKSKALPGRATLNVTLISTVKSSRIPDIWYNVRKTVNDNRADLPDGIVGPGFNDEFGTTYGNIYAITGVGFAEPTLRRYAETLRDRVQQLPDVAKTELVGDQNEAVYVTYDSARLAGAGITPQTIADALESTNAISASGIIDAGPERVRLQVSGTYDALQDIVATPIVINGKSIRLDSFAHIERKPVDPASFAMRFGGQEAVGVGISLRADGDVARLGKDLKGAIAQLQSEMPLGMKIETVSDQTRVVDESVGEFTRSLFEAIVIVLAVNFLSLGWRPGIVVALCIPLVLAMTFTAMLYMGIDLQRISLGALIIALGLLVDDAIIVVESIATHLEAGWTRTRAAVSAFTVTAKPMLIGTLITVAGFLPIVMSQATASEYVKSLFQVIALSLILSWIVAVIFTPYLAFHLLPQRDDAREDAAEPEEQYSGHIYSWFRGVLEGCLHRRKLVVAVTAAIFIASLALFQFAVPRQFFPASDRPEIVVDLQLSRNASFAQTRDLTGRMERLLAEDTRVTSVTSYVGGGSPRFYLPLNVQTPDLTLAELILQTRDEETREEVISHLQELLATRFPEVRGRVSRLENGPSVGQPVQYRVSGPDLAQLVPVADRLEALLRDQARARDVSSDLGEPLKAIRVELDQDKVRALGLSTQAVQKSLQLALSGAGTTTLRDRDLGLDVILRLDEAERTDPGRIANLPIATPQGSIPLSQIGHVVAASEPSVLYQRNGQPTITVSADVEGEQASDLTARIAPEIDKLRSSLPDGAKITQGGSQEQSAINQRATMAAVPFAVFVIVVLLMVQLQNVPRMLVVLATGPLAMIGVALIMATFRIPFGFVAMLGSLALFGMVLRNSVILIAQIDVLAKHSATMREAVREAAVHRLRPIMLTALAAILAMIPLTRSTFWGPMAWAIMGGLMVATILTLIVLPALYELVFDRGNTQPGNQEPTT
ncbi:efflux RND transporter permease subunit [Novosphingobium sp. 1949]|uniref:Efflux RND transporter permease subunit n=1 Tax=Novosphingobium organovorum TaxID=2930092 RepID=A0ABT0BFS5_9SPHN|nr:efflux RND transporter permease subunit [Novosphingobium organovorum]MCJ2183646.1 efflux RND transporter permease subunit [Novosphingobium organovorum]